MTKYFVCSLCLVLAFAGGSGAAVAQTVGSADPTWTPPMTTGTRGPRALAALPDGKVLQVGRDMQSVDRFAVQRFEPDGRLDTSFGTGGTAYATVVPPEEADAEAFSNVTLIKVDALGRIYVSGDYTRRVGIPGNRYVENGYAVARLLANGEVDTSFAGGLLRLPLWRGVDQGSPQFQEPTAQQVFRTRPAFTDMAVQADGKLVLLSHARERADSPPINESIVLVRLHVNGQLDTSFGNGGVVISRLNAPGYTSGLLAAPDGSLFVAGGTQTSLTNSGEPNRALVLKFTGRGLLDPAFGTGGRASIAVTSDPTWGTTATDIALQPDGMIVGVGGRINDGGAGGLSDSLAFRLLPNGALDPGFGNGGVAVVDITRAFEVVREVELESNGKILVLIAAVRSSQTPIDAPEGPHLTRLLPNGNLDSAFGITRLPRWTPGDLAVAQAAFVLTLGSLFPNDVGALYKYVIDPPSHSGSLSTGQEASFSGFDVTMRNNSGDVVDSAALGHTIRLDGYVFPQSSDANASATVYVVAITARGAYMRTASGNFIPWNGQVSALVPAYGNVPLSGITHVPVYAGPLPFAGSYALYLGYRIGNGPLIYTDEAVRVEITQ